VFALVVTVLIAGLMVPVAASQAQGQAPPAQAQAPQQASLDGELRAVDADKKLITVAPKEGAEKQFSYTDQTEVKGGQGGVAGLATMKGVQVTVHYTTEGKTSTAKMIEIHARQ
jgi:Cu/Ag efflux protein CusF